MSCATPRVQIAPMALALLYMTACGNGDDDPLVVIDSGVYQEAPDFALPSLSGGNVALSETAGAVRVINFWATWCAPCREEMPSLERLHRRYRGSGRLVVLAVSVDDHAGVVQEYVEDYGFTFPVLLDRGRVVASNYNVSVFPTSYVVDAGGRVVDRVIGAVDWAQDGLVVLPALEAHGGP